MSRHSRARIAAAGGAALALILIPVAAADAHVSVKPDKTVSGGYAELVFKVPNEKPALKTTSVVVTLPDTTPLTSISVRPVPGWTATITEATLSTPVTVKGTTITKAPHLVTWTATGDAAIGAGQYQSFAISAGPLPAPGQLSFPAKQTYSDGTAIDWADPSVEGQAEPEHPAPSFVVTAAAPAGADATTAGSTTAGSTTAGGTTAATSSSDPVARWLSGGALVASLAALGVTLARRRASTP